MMVYSALMSEFVQCIVYRLELHEAFSNCCPDLMEMTNSNVDEHRHVRSSKLLRLVCRVRV